MARTITQIQDDMLSRIAADEVLSTVLTSSSRSAKYRLMTYVVAVAIWILETFFDQHSAEVTTKLSNQKAGTLPWYREMAKRFQYGYNLVTDHDYYDNTNLTDEEIEASKIVKYATALRAPNSSRVILKIAGEGADGLEPITDEQKDAFDAYVEEFKWPREVTVINYLPDRLYLTWIIKRDAQILNENGMSRINANYPVEEAIAAYQKNLPFNGELFLNKLVDELQKVHGVIDPFLVSAESSWINPDLNGYGDPQPINISKIAESGYFKVETLNITYVE